MERHQDPVFGYVLGMVQDRDLAHDLFQDTFVRVIDALQRRRGGYVQQGRFLPWVMRIARNATLDHIRSRGRRQTQIADDGYWDNIPSGTLSPDHILEAREERAWLQRSIARLPEEQREVLTLRQDSELTFREIAELTDVSINTALGRMRYALLNLRRMAGKRPHTKKKTPRKVASVA